MTNQFRGVLDSITRVRGVRGAMVVSRDDGLVVADSIMEGVKGKAVAALAASLFKRLGRASNTSGAGQPRFMHLQASTGALLTMSAGPEIIMVALTEANANVGLVRLEMLRAAEVVS